VCGEDQTQLHLLKRHSNKFLGLQTLILVVFAKYPGHRKLYSNDTRKLLQPTFKIVDQMEVDKRNTVQLSPRPLLHVHSSSTIDNSTTVPEVFARLAKIHPPVFQHQ
jgi:hypothetical protein